MAISIGIALAHNRIDKTTAANIVGISSVLTPGAVTVEAHDTAWIEVVSIAAALAVALGIGTSVGVAGGASESTNIILGSTTASIEDSVIGTDAAKVASVDVEATSSSTIKAVVGAIAAAVAIGNNAVGVAIGIGVARNFIGYDPYPSSDYTYLSTAIVTTINVGNKVKITGNASTASGQPVTPTAPMYDDIYEYVGPASATPRFDWERTQTETVTLERGRRVRLANGNVYEFTSNTDLAGVNLSAQSDTYFTASTAWRQVSVLEAQDYMNPRLWKRVNLAPTPISVEAFTANTSIASSGAVQILATGTQIIDAVVFSAAVGIAAGVGAGIGVAGAGVYAENRIHGSVKAFVNGTRTGGSIDASTVTITATDASQIDATAVAAAVAVAIGGDLGVAVAIGITIAFNEVDVDVAAHATDATIETATGGDISIIARTLGSQRFSFTPGIDAGQLDDAAAAADDDPQTPATGCPGPTCAGDEAVADAADDAANLATLEGALRTAGHALTSGKWSTDVTLEPRYTSGAGVKDLVQGRHRPARRHRVRLRRRQSGRRQPRHRDLHRHHPLEDRPLGDGRRRRPGPGRRERSGVPLQGHVDTTPRS